MNLTPAEWRLIMSALEYDTQGTWGDGRGEAIEALLRKLKRKKVTA